MIYFKTGHGNFTTSKQHSRELLSSGSLSRPCAFSVAWMRRINTCSARSNLLCIQRTSVQSCKIALQAQMLKMTLPIHSVSLHMDKQGAKLRLQACFSFCYSHYIIGSSRTQVMKLGKRQQSCTGASICVLSNTR